MSSDRSGESSSTTSPGGRHSLSTSSYQAPSLNSPNISMLKAQLELITHERDMLKKDEKWMSSKRDSVPSYNVKHLDNSFHHRTASDTVQPSSPTNKSGLGGSLSRSHSIASSAEKSSFTPFRLPDSSPSNDRLVHELQLSRKQQADNAKKYDQALTDVEYYHKEFESYRTRYNEVLLDKQRLEQELNSLRLMVEDERKEMSELRRQQQDVLNSEVGESLSIMYGTLLRDYETAKDNYTVVRKRYDDLLATHTASVKKLEQSGDEILQYKKLYQEMLTERNQFKQQCTQAIRQWDQALRERNEYKDALAKVQRKHEEAVKEVNQVISVRIKANKDLKRLTDERNAAMQEYSLIMSERDSVHKEIEKLQDEVLTQKKLVSSVESQSKLHDDERKKLYCQIETLKREIDTSLQERDKAIREAHELREKMGMTKNVTESSKSFSSGCSSSGGSKSKFDMEKPRKERESQSAETIEGQHGNANFIKCENLDQANSEIDRLRKLSVKFQSELQDASMEADVAKGRRDMAFSERDKVVLERESIRTLCDKLRRERDRAVSDLAEALRDSDGVKKHRNEIHNENKELRERLEALEKEVRIKSLQRSPGHSHSHDSAIDSDLHEWETENLDIDMNGLGSREDLGLDLSGGRDDVHCPDKPIYISSIYKGSFMDGKLKVNDCILRVNDMDCRDAERDAVLQTLRNSGSAVSLTVRRRRLGRKYTATLHLGGGKESHGLSLDLGVYVVKIQPGSVAAKEGGIAVGDRIISINDSPLDHIRTLSDALKLLNQTKDTLRLTVTKSSSTLSSTTIGPLSSSSSGQNMQEKLAEEDVKVQSPKVASSTMSPIKDTIRGSQEFVKKMLYNPKSGGLASSPSNEKVYYANNGIKSSKQGIMETMKEKIESTVRGRKRSKDHHHNVSNSDMFSNNSFAVHDEGKFRIGSPIEKPLDDEDLAIAELDSVNNYHSGSSGGGTKSSGAEKKKKRSKDRDSFRAGGTWPRARGGPIIELGTGTILHPHKTKRDRLPLAELLSNLPKYPPESSSRVKERTNSSSNRNDESSRSSRKPSRTSGDTGYRRLSRENEEGMQHSCPSKPNSNNAASDTSIDDSVKSAHAGKEVLERYLKKSKSSKTQQQSVLTHSDSDNLSPVMMSPPPPLTLASSTLKMTDSYSAKFDSHHHPVHSLLESGNIIGTSCNTMVSSSVLRSNNNGFGPSSYHGPSNNPVMSTSSILPPHHYGVISSSPRYSSPPPPPSQAQSGDSLILGSPIPDYRNDPNRLSNCEAPQSLSSVSPTPGTFNPSPSPSSGIETVMSRGSQHPRSSSNISSHLPYMHPSSSSVPPGYIQHPHGYSGVSMAQGYRLSEDPASPPHYDYGGVQQRRLGKENNSFSTRIRIPSNTSVTSHGSATKISSSSIDRSLIKCCSPFPVFNIEYLSADGRISEPPQFTRKPLSGEIRQIYIQKSSEQLGFTIDEGSNKGVFVSSVSEKSLAQLVGLQVGDQLLDVCGINLRSCGKEQAALVLHQVGNTITLKVQYNPEDFLEEDDDDDDEDEEDEDVDVEDDVRADEVLLSSEDEDVDLHRRRRRRRRTSDSPTPRNSPKDSLKHFGPPPSYATLMKHHRINKDKVTAASLHSSPMRGPSVSPPYEPRIVYPTMQKSGDLGVRLVGGNAVGIFIHSIEIDSAAYKVGLRSADQILEYNGVDLRQATAEQAAYELAKPADKVSILVQYNPDKYQVIKDQPGDSYYVRSMFDRLPEYSSPHQLSFSKDDILYIDNTMYNGVPGNWSAWVVDTDGQKRQWGIIPCKYKVEEELLMRRSMGNLDVERRTWTTARRSFFKRKKGTRSGSRDSKELASYSDMGSLSYSDSGNLHEDVQINSYIRVERLDYLVTRPVLIIGPLADAVLDKLISDYPHKFARCEPELMDCDQEALEKGLMDNILIDFRRRGGNRFECTTTQVIKDISDRNQHCILNIHVEAVERLHMNQIYPIVLLIKFKSVKQIREMKDPRYHAEKISQKDAKNIFEHTQKLETEYKHLISDTIHAGANLMLMCAQIASKIEQEQAKTLWVPSGTIW